MDGLNASGGGLAPAGFEENKGQVRTTAGDPAPEVRYRLTQGSTSIYLLGNGIAYQFNRLHLPEGLEALERDARHDPAKQKELIALREQTRLETYRMDMLLEGADPQARITAEGRSPDHTHYYNRDVMDVHSYTRITYHDVYPGIDWVLYTTAKGLKHDFVVRPGADPGLIRLRFMHHEELRVEADGSLTHGNRMGRFTEAPPVSFQQGRAIGTRFLLEGDVLRFALDEHDPGQTLTIDPARLWATYYGGAGPELGGWCATTVNGDVLLAGTTASTGAIASGGLQNTLGGDYDAFLVLLSASGTRIWGTYYGGGDYDAALSVATDLWGNVYLAGYTYSASGIAAGWHQNLYGGNADAFLVKFNYGGGLLWATYYGGGGFDSARSIAVDPSGNVYLGGYTASLTGMASSGHQNAFGGGDYDCFLAKFNAAGTRLWATYYGGIGSDQASACATDNSGNVYLAGGTESTVGMASGGHQVTHAGDYDGFLVKFNPSGAHLWSSYYGGYDEDYVNGCVTDGSGNVYLAGHTSSTAGIASSGHQNSFSGGSKDGFLAKFNAAGTRLWATYYGGPNEDWGVSCARDGSGNVYLAGLTNSTSGIASGGFQNTLSGANYDAFLAKFNASGTRLWATYYGGTEPDYGYSTSVDPSGNVYLAGETLSASGIANAGHQNSIGDAWDTFLVKFAGSPPTITTNIITSSLCANGSTLFPVYFTTTGLFGTGNVFSAQLSDASGSFASPVDISSVTIGPSTILAYIPSGTPTGSGYRIRVVSSNPPLEGTPNSTDLVISAPTAYYQDSDGDSYGNPAVMLLLCEPPTFGYVTNNSDCNDDNPSITVVGTACDADPGPGYLPGELNASCECITTFSCTETVILVFETGSTPSQLTWEIRDAVSAAILHSGTGAAYPPNHLHFVPLCMPTNMCFKLSVTDAGDGAHGYRLFHDATITRIIDNLGNLGAGLSEMSGSESFCLPMGDNRLIFNSCDKYWWRSGEYLVADPDPDVSAQYGVTNTTSGYEFWIYNPNGGYSFRRFRNHATSDGFGTDNAVRACHMKLNNWAAANHVPEFDLHNVRVRARVAGVNKPWGPACRMVRNEALALCPPTKLLDIPGNRYISCGQSRRFVSSQQIHAQPVSGANRYQWRFRIPAEGVEITRTSTTYFLNLGWGPGVAPPLVAGKTYQVEVRASRDGGLTWCGTADPWGDVCLLSITSAMSHPLDPPSDLGIDEPRLSLWPNPNNGDELWVSLEGIAAELETVTAEVYDVNGRRVVGQVLPTQYGQLYAPLEVNGLARGMYLVHLTAGEQRFAQRLVIER